MIGASFALMRWPLVGSWIDTGQQKDRVRIRSLELQGGSPEGLEVEFIADHAYVTKPP